MRLFVDVALVVVLLIVLYGVYKEHQYRKHYKRMDQAKPDEDYREALSSLKMPRDYLRDRALYEQAKLDALPGERVLRRLDTIDRESLDGFYCPDCRHASITKLCEHGEMDMKLYCGNPACGSKFIIRVTDLNKAERYYGEE